MKFILGIRASLVPALLCTPVFRASRVRADDVASICAARVNLFGPVKDRRRAIGSSDMLMGHSPAKNFRAPDYDRHGHYIGDSAAGFSPYIDRFDVSERARLAHWQGKPLSSSQTMTVRRLRAFLTSFQS